jgi:hypothetical protein
VRNGLAAWNSRGHWKLDLDSPGHTHRHISSSFNPAPNRKAGGNQTKYPTWGGRGGGVGRFTSGQLSYFLFLPHLGDWLKVKHCYGLSGLHNCGIFWKTKHNFWGLYFQDVPVIKWLLRTFRSKVSKHERITARILRVKEIFSWRNG